MKYSLRQKLGALILDAPRYGTKLLQNNWLEIKNRGDQFVRAPDGVGLKCDWQWTNSLHLPKVFPWFGTQLLEVVLNNCKFDLKKLKTLTKQKPEVSFIIGHRGKVRTTLLLKTLESIAAQTNCEFECIVVEQDNEPHLAKLLPDWVKYIVTPLPYAGMPYSRAWAFNVGAQHASADCIVLHDNDLLVSSIYASEILRRYKQGYEFINLKRFIFYLSEGATADVLEGAKISSQLCLDSIMQNAVGGGSIGVSRRAYFEIGGFDERFVGWGGEDNEFWERALTRKVWEYGYLPLVHLWHAPQTGKNNIDKTETKALYERLSQICPSERIDQLRKDGKPELVK